MAKILIAEDDESIRELLKYIVSGAGYETVAVDDGQKAIDAVAREKPDLALLDVMLPEVHGYSICHHIKSTPDLAHIKVLFVSAKSFPADRRQAEGVGADGFLSKPVDPSELIDKIKSLLA